MAFDPEAVHVPDAYDPNHSDAVQFQRSTTPDPTRGLTVDDVEAEQERARRATRYYRGGMYTLILSSNLTCYIDSAFSAV
jgi:hypothetical protein